MLAKKSPKKWGYGSAISFKEKWIWTPFGFPNLISLSRKCCSTQVWFFSVEYFLNWALICFSLIGTPVFHYIRPKTSTNVLSGRYEECYFQLLALNYFWHQTFKCLTHLGAWRENFLFFIIFYFQRNHPQWEGDVIVTHRTITLGERKNPPNSSSLHSPAWRW